MLNLGDLLSTLDNPRSGYLFGSGAAISGDTVVVTDYSYNGVSGAAYIYDARTGNLLHTIDNPTPGTYDSFGGGQRVAISGSTLVVASDDSTFAYRAGAVYIFDVSTGNLLRTIHNPTPAPEDYFGVGVAISGGTLVVGAYRDDTGAVDAGSVYIYDVATGNLLRTINDPNPAESDYFGWSVAISGNTVVVGAMWDDTGATDAGAVYLFDATTGDLLHTINNPVPHASDCFGSAVAVSGTKIVVGAPGWNDPAMGYAYVFDAATGNLVATLNNPTPTLADNFGHSVAVSGNTALVGAFWEDTGGWHSGSAYMYDATTGNLLKTIDNPAPGRYYYFGWSVALSETRAVVGSPSGWAGSPYDAAFVFDANRASGPPSANIVDVTPDPRTTAVDQIQIVFSAAVTGFDRADLTLMRNGGGNLLTASQTLTTTDNITWTLGNLSGITGTDGTYVLTLTAAGSGITNAAGIAIAADASDSWLVDTTPPTADVVDVTPDPRATAVGSIAILFSKPVSGFNLGDLGLTRDGGGNLLTASQTLSTSDNVHWTLGGLSGLTGTDGNYVLTLTAAGSGITDAAGNALAGDASDSWVTIVPPTADIADVTPDPRTTAVDQIQIVFSEAVSGFDLADLTLTRDGGANLLTASQTLTTTDNITWTLGNLSGITGTDGTYVLTLTAAGSGIIDAAGNPLAADATDQWVRRPSSLGDLLWTLNNPTPTTGDWFGYSVAVSGNTTVVGAPFDSPSIRYEGAAFIFDAATGSLLHTLNNPTPADYDNFGLSVAVSGNTVVVGAPEDDTGAYNAGSAYVFDAATGSLLRTLNNPTPASGAFGYSVSVSGSTIVVGGASATDAGFAYIFDAATGGLLYTLSNPTPATGDWFGSSVAVSGTTVVVGALYDDTGATDSGAAYIFDATTGNLLWTLNNPTPAVADQFGYAVAVSGSTLVVGAAGDSTGAYRAGSAYIYDAATGNLLRTINNPTPAESDGFGGAVAVSGSTVVATATAAVYVLDATTGTLLGTLNNPRPGVDNGFGQSVAVSANWAVVGAIEKTIGPGSAYIFDATRGLTADVVDVTPDPRTTAVDQIQIVFSAAVTGFDRGDLTLTRDGGANLLTPSQSLSTTDNVHWTLGGLSGLTATPGTYVLTLTAAGSGIIDAAGYALAANASDSWVLDTTAPTADIVDVSPDPRTTAVTSIAILFSEPVSGFDLTDVALTRNGGANLLTGSQTLSTGDNVHWTLGGLAGLTSADGNYVLTLTATGSGILDVAGNPLAADASDSWATIVPPTADIADVTPDPRTTAVAEVQVVFSKPVTGLDLADLNLTRSGGPNLLSSSQTLTTSDNVAWTLGNLGGITGRIGTYDLTLQAAGSGIIDAAGSPLAFDATERWVFSPTTLTADVVDVTPDPRTTSVESIAIVFGKAVEGFDLADLTLTRDGGANLLTSAQTLASADNVTWTLSNLGGITGTVAMYDLLLTAAGSGITDVAGNVLAADATDQWVVSTASITGTSGDDLFEFIAAGAAGGLPTMHQMKVRLAGSPMVTYLYDAAGPVSLSIDAKEGSDKLTITGGPGTDTTVLNRYFVQHTGPGASTAPGYYYVSANNVETIVDNAGAGTGQRVTLNDSPDNGDVFTASAYLKTGSMKSAAGSLNVYNNSSTGYDQIYGIAGNGGANDIAYLYDSNGNDYYVSRAGAMTNPQSYIQRTSGGTGTAALVTAVSGFETVYGMATAGGVDEAVLFGSNGDDSMRFEPGYTSGGMVFSRVYMTRPGNYFIYAQNFKKVTGYPEDGNDQVAFFDTAGDDVFTASPTDARLTGPAGSNILNIAATDQNNPANKWDTVRAYSQVGGYDKAYLTGSTGNDTFLGFGKPRTTYAGMGRLSGTGYFLEVNHFEEVYANLLTGNDTANFYDGSANDYFWAKLGAAVLTDGTLNDATGDLVTPNTYYYKVYGFDSAAGDHVNLYGNSGGTNTKRVITPLDYVLAAYGSWIDAP